MNPQRVYLVDDDAAVRDAVRVLLELTGIPVESFASGEEFLEKLDPEWTGCVLLDLKMAGKDGLQVQQEMIARSMEIPVVIMTAHGDVSTVRSALKAGAFDFLEKPVERQVLVDLVRNVFGHDERRRRVSAERDDLKRRAARLTMRESQVMSQLIEGRQHREIAEELKISPRTVEVYKARLMEKLGARSLADVIHIGTRLAETAGR